ncbi:tetratricopeptide repeat protein [Bradyrhizobium prioriisuperbiae]|uniref:tetratricopeptide repeat protein n=1 Tax=Bradyrhizobium prioriisuperbiae TaxID=2854389 RepID=UPI0028F01775|nr:tetratricopeptide repeat protein [Bradyrhizobium prioritasuperba]
MRTSPGREWLFGCEAARHHLASLRIGAAPAALLLSLSVLSAQAQPKAQSQPKVQAQAQTQVQPQAQPRAPLPQQAEAEPIKGEASFSAGGGYARLVLKLAEDVDSEVMTAGSILVIRFKKPIDIPVESLANAVPDYVGMARRDPDGMAIRLALSRKVTVNSMTAGERIFIDLLPESWKGLPPPLPQEVVRELAERARVAERALRQQKLVAETRKRPPVRVRASVQPTFVRFVFELPSGVGVSSSLEDKKLSLVFATPMTFDLTDAKLVAPANISAIEQKIDGEGATVSFAVIGDVDVKSFREDANYVVDVGFDQSRKSSALVTPKTDTRAEPKTETKAAPPVVTKPASVAPDKSSAVTPQAEPAAEPVMEQIKAAAAATPPPAAVPEAAAPPAPIAAVPVASPTPAPEMVRVEAAPARDDATVTVRATRSSDGLRLAFPFKTATPAAAFRRGDAVWLVVDDQAGINTEAIRRDGGSIIGDVVTQKLDKGQAIRIRLGRPQLASLAGEGTGFVLTLADTMEMPQQPLSAIRNIADPARAHVAVMLANPAIVHHLIDPEAGDPLTVVTAPLPAHGFVKRQDFVEFALLESIHGVVVQSNADDLAITTSPDRVVLTRPGGLTLSSADLAPQRIAGGPRPLFDLAEWRQNRDAIFGKRQDELISAAAQANGDARTAANIELARFYLARGFYPEAKGAADLALADAKPGTEDPTALIVRAVASILSGHPEAGLKDFGNSVIGSGYDLQVWKGLAAAGQDKWPDAREKFKNAEFAIAALPDDLQRIVLATAMRASLVVRDYAGASARSNDLDVIGIPPERMPAIAVMRAGLAEALGREKEALSVYRDVIASNDRPAAAEARLREIALRQKRNEIGADEALQGLETLAVSWRGGDIELETLQQLARVYAASARYADSFAAARLVTRLSANSDVSRQTQDETSALFSQVFLGPKGDELPPIEALGMFYDYRELTPIGRRGDEMIRRLSERLANVDLLDQAADLLQYQVDHRLEGAARAQVAARLATVYLMNRKPDRAGSVLRDTRIADLAGELRQQRLLLEARAQSDIGRHDLALDIVSNLTGREVVRLRSDIYWAARRWRESAEQVELYYGDRWKDFQPLNTVEKGDVIRAAIGYALAEDVLGLARFREKFGPKMSSGADRVAFDIASKPVAASSAEFTQIAKMAASVDTLDGFLREMKTRFGDTTMAKAVLPRAISQADPTPTGTLPKVGGVKSASAVQ